MFNKLRFCEFFFTKFELLDVWRKAFIAISLEIWSGIQYNILNCLQWEKYASHVSNKLTLNRSEQLGFESALDQLKLRNLHFGSGPSDVQLTLDAFNLQVFYALIDQLWGPYGKIFGPKFWSTDRTKWSPYEKLRSEYFPVWTELTGQ